MSNALRKGIKTERGMERSPEQPESYVLRGGQAGAVRLRLINRVKWPTTERLLNQVGLQAGMRVLDFGCGSGEVTRRMATLVGAEGEVVGIDLDASILRLAQREALDLNVPVTFRHLGAEELEEVAAYDFAYARYLLSHLRHPERALEAMVRALRPGAGWPSRTSSSPATSATRPTPPSSAMWSSTGPSCAPKAQTRRLVRV